MLGCKSVFQMNVKERKCDISASALGESKKRLWFPWNTNFLCKIKLFDKF